MNEPGRAREMSRAVTARIAYDSARLGVRFHSDPADQLIAATAQVKAATALGAIVAGGLTTYLARTALRGDPGLRVTPALAAVWVASSAGATFAYRATASRAGALPPELGASRRGPELDGLVLIPAAIGHGAEARLSVRF